jgi:transcriptional regulator with XRE-family HTH domain
MTKQIIEKYEALALDNSLSLCELARLAGVAQSTLSRWRGGMKPKGATLRKFDAALRKLELAKEHD